MAEYCNSCGAPLGTEEFKGPSDKYCKYCTDESGQVKPYDEVKAGIASWIKKWQDVDDEKASVRADHWPHAMPEWAD
jgi:hypothetical protein